MRKLRQSGGQAAGEFWLAGSDAAPLPGRLDVRGRWPRIELAGELTPAFELIETRETGTRVYGPASDSEEHTIHGQLGGSYGRVTLLKAVTRRRSLVMGGGPSEQVLEGRYCLVGGHVDSVATQYDQARLHLANAEEWAHLPGLSMSVVEPGHDITIAYHAPESLEVAVPSFGATLTVEPQWSVPPPKVTGASITTAAWLRWTVPTGQTLSELLREFVTPLSTLLTLLVDDLSRALALEVRDPATERWLDVYGPTVVDDVSTDPATPLLSLGDLGLPAVARWLEYFSVLSPVPQIVAGAVAVGNRTVENQVLELATAAEGLHRRLYPADRQLTDEQVETGLKALDDIAVNGQVREVLHQALRTYLWDRSYPQRLKTLIKDVESTAPDVVGRANRWRRLVTDARIGFAHSKPGSSSTEAQAREYLVLARSLRWLLTLRLLLAAGIDTGALRESVAKSQKYQQFLTTAREALPSVYPTENA